MQFSEGRFIKKMTLIPMLFTLVIYRQIMNWFQVQIEHRYSWEILMPITLLL